MKKFIILLVLYLLQSNIGIAETLYAELTSTNVVKRVIVVPDSHASDGETWVSSFLGGTWKRTYYDSSVRGKYAGIGDTYQAIPDKFLKLKLTIIGDSIIDFMRTAELPDPYKSATYLAKGGDTLNEIKARVPFIPTDTTHLIVEGGTNDGLGYGTYANVIPGYTDILNNVPSHIQILVLGIPQIDSIRLEQVHPGWTADPYNNLNIAIQNSQISALCNTRPNCKPIISFMNSSMVNKTTDGIHFLPEGYQTLVSNLNPYLQ